MKVRFLSKKVIISSLIRLSCLAVFFLFILGSCFTIWQKGFRSQFMCSYDYYPAYDSQALILYTRQPGYMVPTIGLMVFMAISVVAYLYSRKNYSLAKLIMGTLLIGTAGLAGIYIDLARGTLGSYMVKFHGPVPKDEFLS